MVKEKEHTLKTTITFKDLELWKRANHKALDENLSSNDAIVETALRSWLNVKPFPKTDETPAAEAQRLRWMLDAVIDANMKRPDERTKKAVEAITENLEAFYMLATRNSPPAPKGSVQKEQ